MSKKLTLCALACCLSSTLLLSQVANAAEGTIKFDGTIIKSPCELSTNNVEVPFGNITSDTFSAANNLSLWTPFSIKLTNCTLDDKSTIKSVNVEFQGDPVGDKDGQTGLPPYLKISSSEPDIVSNLAIKLTYPDKTLIPINSIPNSDDPHNVPLTAGTNSYDLNYGAQLIALKNFPADKTGTFTASANFTIQYF